MRFRVLPDRVWASQCGKCWRVIAYSPDRYRLACAEAAHECSAKKSNARVTPEPTHDNSSEN